MASGEDRLIWGEGSMEDLAPLKNRYRQNPDGTFTFEQGRDVIGQAESNQMQGLAGQARNKPQTNIDRYWLDQDIAQGQASRGLQQQGLGQLREAAMGNAPSQAALMANMARGRAAATGVGATGGLAARQAAMGQSQAMQAAAMGGAGARSDELGRATGAYLGGTGQAMGGDLRQRGASADEAYQTARTGLRDKAMAAKYGLGYERLGQGYRDMGTGAVDKVADMQASAAGGRAQRNAQREQQWFQAGMGGITGALSYMSGITTKTDIAPAASAPKMGAPLQPDQIAAAFGPDVAAAVERSRNKYKPQNALAQMPQFSQGVEVAPALARSNDVPVDLSALQANADVPSDVRAKKDIEMSGKSNPNSAGKKLIVGQPAPLPALAPPQEESWIPIGQIAGSRGLARIHSDANSKKEIEKLREENAAMREVVGGFKRMAGSDAGPKGSGESPGVYADKNAGKHTKKEVDTPDGKATEYGPVSPGGVSRTPANVRLPGHWNDQSRVAEFGDQLGVYGAGVMAGSSAPSMVVGQGQAYAMRPELNKLQPDPLPLPDRLKALSLSPPRVLSSDERGKVGGPGSHTADAFLDSLSDSASTYRYKDPSMEPSTTGGTGGKYLGIMAQRVEQTPEIGKQLVKDTPQGKVVEGQAMLSALAGGLGRLHQKVKEMGGRRGR